MTTTIHYSNFPKFDSKKQNQQNQTNLSRWASTPPKSGKLRVCNTSSSVNTRKHRCDKKFAKNTKFKNSNNSYQDSVACVQMQLHQMDVATKQQTRSIDHDWYWNDIIGREFGFYLCSEWIDMFQISNKQIKLIFYILFEKKEKTKN